MLLFGRRQIGEIGQHDVVLQGDGDSLSRRADSLQFFDDGPEKPIRIWSRIGRRPTVAGGNSNGDIPMMRFARGSQHRGQPDGQHDGRRDALRLLVLHDDPDREFAYTAGAEQALDRGGAEGWTIVSMRDDWDTVFAAC